MILEPATIAFATIAFTAFHPALVFGRRWHEADFRLGGGSAAATKQANGDIAMEKGWKSIGSSPGDSSTAVFGTERVR